MAIKVGKPVSRKVIQNQNKFVVSECPLAAPHIKQGMDKIEKNDVEVLCTLLKFYLNLLASLSI